MNKISIHHLIIALSISFLISCSNKKEQIPPNILMIAVDDMNNWVGAWGGQALTPNIDKLANTGVMFENAYCVVPACNPSRAALLTGQRPETTGLYTNEGCFRDNPGGNDRITLPQYLQKLGYQTVAAGKIFHQPRGNGEIPAKLSDPISWDYQWKGNVGTPGHDLFLDENGMAKWMNGAGNSLISDPNSKGGFNYISKFGVWGAIPQKKEECGDWQLADFCAKFLQKEHDKPFFLSMGIFRPHSPQLAPKEYFDRYNKEDLELPELPCNDMDDIPKIAQENFSSPFVKLIHQKNELRNAIHGYLACMSFADDCVGHVLEALENSKYSENTIVIFWTDHGWQLAHKNRWEKFSLWDQANNAPMIIKAPGIKPGKIAEKVSFLDLYPTIVELLKQDKPTFLEGNSLVPLLKNNDFDWQHASVVTFPKKNYSVQFKNWNYILYEDGSEELYNHSTDPKEFNNIATESTYQTIKTELKSRIPLK